MVNILKDDLYGLLLRLRNVFSGYVIFMYYVLFVKGRFSGDVCRNNWISDISG